MLKGLFRKPATTSPEPSAAAEIPYCYRALYRADGTTHQTQFKSLVQPMLDQVSQSATDAEFQTLLSQITGALNRAVDVRFPLDRAGADYRRFETIYNYALIVVMTMAWWMQRNKWDPDTLENALEAYIPKPGLTRLKHEPDVWDDVRAFFTGGADGGLRQVSRVNWQSIAPAPENHPLMPSADSEPQSTSNSKSERFLTPHSSQWANPLSKGWALVEAIREGLRDGSLPYNRKQAWVQVDREGRTFLQVPEVFEWCYERLDAEVPPKTLVNQFGRLNICTRTRKGQNLLRGGRRNQKAYQQGFVVEDPSLFWDGEPPADQFYIRHLTRHGFGQSLQSPPDSAA